MTSLAIESNLEYITRTNCPYLRADIHQLKRIQITATRLLRALTLPTVENERLRGNLLTTLIILYVEKNFVILATIFREKVRWEIMT